jgi:hypothetical protein
MANSAPVGINLEKIFIITSRKFADAVDKYVVNSFLNIKAQGFTRAPRSKNHYAATSCATWLASK